MPVFDVKSPGAVGLVYQEDSLPFDLPPNAWTFAYNVRFRDGGAESCRGWLQRTTLPEQCRQIAYNSGIAGNYWLAFGETGIYSVQDALAVLEVSRRVDQGDAETIVPYSSGDWHNHNFQGIPVATNNVDMPQAQFQTGTAPGSGTFFLDLSNGYGWPGTDTCKLLVGYKDFLVALNLTESGTNYPTKLRWSNAAAPGNLPADWGVADPASLSGELVLPADSGPIVAAETLGDVLIIYTTNGVHRLTYIGGAFVMRRDTITRNFGAFGPHSVVDVKRQHILLTRDDLGWFDGVSFRSMLNGRAKHTLQKFLTSGESGSARIAYNGAYDEVWFAMVFPTTRGLFTVFNTLDISSGAIAQRPAPSLVDFAELPDREVTDRLVIAQLTLNQIAQLPQYDGLEKVGDATLDEVAYSGSLDDFYVIGLGFGGELYRMDYGNQFLPLSEVPEARLERTDLDLTGDESACMVLAAYPRFQAGQVLGTPNICTLDDIDAEGTRLDGSDNGDPDYSQYEVWQFCPGFDRAVIYIGSQAAAGAPVEWRSPKVMQDRRKVTTKARGVRHAVKIVSKGQFWRLSGYKLEYNPVGLKGRGKQEVFV